MELTAGVPVRPILTYLLHADMQWVSMQDNEIASALVDLFQAFAQRAQGHSHQEVDPTLLRQALSRLPGGKFRVGE